VCVRARACVRACVRALQGADYLPLAFNDKVATPPDYARFFSEKLIYLPNSYYVNSHLTSFDAQVAMSKEPCKSALHDSKEACLVITARRSAPGTTAVRGLRIRYRNR
jgi:hypothetical protein